PFAMYYALRFEKWDEVLAMPKPDDSMPTTVALWHYGRAVAFLAKKKIEEADAEKTAFDEASAKVPADAMMNLNTSKALLNVAARSLEARMAEAKGGKGAIILWMRAVNAEAEL